MEWHIFKTEKVQRNRRKYVNVILTNNRKLLQEFGKNNFEPHAAHICSTLLLKDVNIFDVCVDKRFYKS